ncbi:MAG: hypothetical protein ACRCXT_23820 [Paraclostridium sp.]
MKVKKLLKRMYGENRILVMGKEVWLDEPYKIGTYLITKIIKTKVVGRVK